MVGVWFEPETGLIVGVASVLSPGAAVVIFIGSDGLQPTTSKFRDAATCQVIG